MWWLCARLHSVGIYNEQKSMRQERVKGDQRESKWEREREKEWNRNRNTNWNWNWENEIEKKNDQEKKIHWKYRKRHKKKSFIKNNTAEKTFSAMNRICTHLNCTRDENIERFHNAVCGMVCAWVCVCMAGMIYIYIHIEWRTTWTVMKTPDTEMVRAAERDRTISYTNGR